MNRGAMMNKQDFLKTYPHKLELHAHSMPVSPCCNCPMERCLELYAQKEVEAICLTNHFYPDSPIFAGKDKKDCIDAYLRDYEMLKDLAKPYGIRILLGCEIRFAENNNDYLIYGVDRAILEEAFDYLPFDLAIYRSHVKLPDSLFIQAHPFRDGIVLADPALLDGIETVNCHPSHNGRNSSSAAYAKEKGFEICTGGTDFHHDRPYYAATVLTLSKTVPETSFELARLLREKDYVFLLGGNHIVIP